MGEGLGSTFPTPFEACPTLTTTGNFEGADEVRRSKPDVNVCSIKGNLSFPNLLLSSDKCENYNGA